MLLEDAHALVIGISRYQHVETLPANQDAQDVAAALLDPDHCGYPPATVRRLLDEEATRAAMLDALDELARTTSEASTVVIYFSGHGTRAASRGTEVDDSYYVMPVDATASRAEIEQTAISNRELSARLRAIPASRLTLVLDCCHAADMAVPRLAQAIAPLAQGRGRAVLAGSRATDYARTMSGRRNSTLTGHLLDGLRGEAWGVGGVIRICDLFHYVQRRVANEAMEQHPVFKAELEENYPIAQLHGGTPEAFAIPAIPDEFCYDAFVSYSRRDADDRAWVMTVIVPFLERLGLRLCLEHRDFRLGQSRVDELERAVTQSRYTIAVFTPAYLEGAFEIYQSLLAAHVAIESRAPRFIPLIRRPCPLVLHARMAEALDVSRDAEVGAALQRLAVALRQAPRQRLDPAPGPAPA